MIKKGVAVKLQKKDHDSARYRYGIAKRALAEKESVLCIAAIKSSQRVLSNARPTPPKPTKSYASSKQNLTMLANTIALGDASMFPAKVLFLTEAKLAKANKTASSPGRRACGWNIKTAMEALEPHRKALAANNARINAAVKACPKRNNRNRASCLRKALGNSTSIRCTAPSFKKAERNILAGLKSVKDRKVLRSAEQQYYRAVRAKRARQWKNCSTGLTASLKIISSELLSQRKQACKTKVSAYTSIFARQIAGW